MSFINHLNLYILIIYCNINTFFENVHDLNQYIQNNSIDLN